MRGTQALLALLLALTGTCTDVHGADAARPALAADHAPPPSMLVGRWRLASLQSMDDTQGTTRPPAGRIFRMDLYADGTVALHLDCNLASGTWSARPAADGTTGRFRFPGPLATTLAACPHPQLRERILAGTDYVRSFFLDAERLALSLLADGGIWLCKRVDAAPPALGGPRAWRMDGAPSGLNLRAGPSLAAAVIASVPQGTILTNLDCEAGEARTWCDVQPLAGDARGYAAAALLVPAADRNGVVPRGPHDSALRAGEGDFDASARLPCARTAGQPMTRCDAEVARAGGGYATVVVRHRAGGRRALYFALGRLIGADTSQAHGYPPVTATREADLTLVRVGAERCEVPGAFLHGD